MDNTTLKIAVVDGIVTRASMPGGRQKTYKDYETFINAVRITVYALEQQDISPSRNKVAKEFLPHNADPERQMRRWYRPYGKDWEGVLRDVHRQG